VANTQLRKEGINRSNLNSGATAIVAQFRRIHMVASIGNEKRQCGKSFDNLLTCFGTRKPLKQFLKDEAGGDDGVTGLKAAAQFFNLVRSTGRVATQSKGPDARIDENGQERVRPVLWSRVRSAL